MMTIINYIGNLVMIDIITRKMGEIANEDFIGYMTGKRPDLVDRNNVLDAARHEAAAENDAWAAEHSAVFEKLYAAYGAYRSELPRYCGEWVVKKPTILGDTFAGDDVGIMPVEWLFNLNDALLDMAQKQPEYFAAYRRRAENI